MSNSSYPLQGIRKCRATPENRGARQSRSAGVDHALKRTGEEEDGSNAARGEGGRPELVPVAGDQRDPREAELRDSVDEESREKSRNLEYFRTAFFLKLSGLEFLAGITPSCVMHQETRRTAYPKGKLDQPQPQKPGTGGLAGAKKCLYFDHTNQKQCVIA